MMTSDERGEEFRSPGERERRVFEGAYEEPPIEQRKWAFLAHISAFAGFVIPFGNLLGPLIVWQMKRYDMPFAAEQAKEALNFQITMSIALTISAVLMVVFVGFLLLPLLVLAGIVLTLIAALHANDGKPYRYPFNLRLVR
ncbi:MAG TPA: DUF4870 domain-containing protein [Gammaproteobacteria bacterium]|nr:DUF4870 domain-containing protein [Gammaproteobacteria bacterium]